MKYSINSRRRKNSYCDPSQLAFEYIMEVSCQLFLRFRTDRKGYQKIARAFAIVDKKLADTAIRKAQTRTESRQYENSIPIIRDFINDNLRVNSPLVNELKAMDFSIFSIKIYLFILFFLALESPSATIHFLLLQLGRDEHKHLQQTIREDSHEAVTLKKCIMEALRVNTPAHSSRRRLQRDIVVTLRNSENNIVWSKYLHKGQYLINWMAGIAKDPHLFSHPEQFNPLRFKNIPTQLPWLPFGSGPHICPGQFLTKIEVESFLREILRRFEISTHPSDIPFSSKGVFTLHPDPEKKMKIHLGCLGDTKIHEIRQEI